MRESARERKTTQVPQSLGKEDKIVIDGLLTPRIESALVPRSSYFSQAGRTLVFLLVQKGQPHPLPNTGLVPTTAFLVAAP